MILGSLNYDIVNVRQRDCHLKWALYNYWPLLATNRNYNNINIPVFMLMHHWWRDSLTFWRSFTDFCSLSTASTCSSGPVLLYIDKDFFTVNLLSEFKWFNDIWSLTSVETPVSAQCCNFSLHTSVPCFLPGRSGWFCFSFLSQFPVALLPEINKVKMKNVNNLHQIWHGYV